MLRRVNYLYLPVSQNRSSTRKPRSDRTFSFREKLRLSHNILKASGQKPQFDYSIIEEDK